MTSSIVTLKSLLRSAAPHDPTWVLPSARLITFTSSSTVASPSRLQSAGQGLGGGVGVGVRGGFRVGGGRLEWKRTVP